MSRNPQISKSPAASISGLPSRPGRRLLQIVLGGAVLIGGTFAGAWYYMSMKHARKASREPGEPGALPSWEYRLSQAVDPVRGAGSGTPTVPNKRPANTVESRTLPLDAPNHDPDRSQHRTLSSGDGVLRAENGAVMHPVPQRDRGDGLPYTKRPRIAHGIKQPSWRGL
ncbi:hypothetical protein BGW80DRAFT_1458828 [Lactifluus volemus]|nr:hypothetical protein BGW80DRAFT_1458828 [Lactifluus volemus]